MLFNLRKRTVVNRWRAILFLLFSTISTHVHAADQPEHLIILASIRPLTLLAQDLVQGLPVEVKTLLPANADPHNWALRVSDRALLADADLVVWLGPDFEGFLAKPLRARPSNHLELGLLPALEWPSAAIEDDGAHEHHGHSHRAGRDMHLWLNPGNALVILDALAARLGQLQPAWQPALTEQLQRQRQLIIDMEKKIKLQLGPHQAKGFIAFHDTYGHFVQAFHLRQLASVNSSAEQRLSVKKLSDLQKKARGARCLMVEQSSDYEKRVAQQLKLVPVKADALAYDLPFDTYSDFIDNLAEAFGYCFLR